MPKCLFKRGIQQPSVREKQSYTAEKKIPGGGSPAYGLQQKNK
jgi:hypothetical protein